MDCREFLARYTDYDDSLVPPPETERFRAHMAVCPACERYDRVLRKGRMLARQLRVDGSHDFTPRLRQRLWRESHSSGDVARPARIAAALAALTVLLAASATVGLLAAGPSDPSEPAAPGVRPVAAVGFPVRAEPAALSAATPSGTAPALRRTHLPPLAGPRPRPWTAQRVDRRVPAAYSPLVVGPPAYRRTVSPKPETRTLH